MLRIEKSANCSGPILNASKIKVLKRKNFYVLDIDLDGDAPKQFIRVYEYKKGIKFKRSSRSKWSSYIAKTAEKWYPHESIIEYMINRIGQQLGLCMNEVDLVIANNQIRFLSKYFLDGKNEKLVHGAEICGEYLGDIIEAKRIANNKVEAREIFTFEFIKDALRNVFPNDFDNLIQEFVRMLIFDAIVGNNDRHFYNWGVIQNVRSKNKIIKFAPIYDSARGLLWNYSEENIKITLENHNRNHGKKIDKYINESKPRVSIEENKSANHLELISFIKYYNDDFKELIIYLCSEENEDLVLNLLEKEIFIFFSKDRCDLLKIVLKERFKKLRNL